MSTVGIALGLCYDVDYVFAPSNRLTPVYCVDTDSNRVSISFDAAWGADKTGKILDILDDYNIKATFFLVGFWIDAYPSLTHEIASRGHEIGTHSSTHPQMSKLSSQQMRTELTDCMQKITDITGNRVTLFRPPFGDYNNTLIEVSRSLNVMPIQWSVDSLDWKGLSAKEIKLRVMKAKNGSIILCHNNSDHIVEALPLIITALMNKGLKFVPIGDLVYPTNYTIDSQGVQHFNKDTVANT